MLTLRAVMESTSNLVSLLCDYMGFIKGSLRPDRWKMILVA